MALHAHDVGVMYPQKDALIEPAARRLIVALDAPHDLENPKRLITADDAVDIVEKLGDEVSFYKVGWALFLAAGYPVIEDLVRRGKRVFLDLKFTDIPETVHRLVAVAARAGVTCITVSANRGTVRAAVEARGSSPLKILTVTLLTSLDQTFLRDELGSGDTVESFVLRQARHARAAGCDGVIASGREAALIRQDLGDESFLIVTPAIRPAGDPADDQKRTATPGEAVRAGADYLVVGRPILRARNPRDVARRIIEDIGQALDSR
jgi:orotidine-5'-phosphate decarboxylase